MNNRLSLKVATVATFTFSAWHTCFSQENTEKPNVLIIVLDDAGYNDFGFMGCPDIKTPHIDALAAEGVILTDAHTSATVSGPSRAGILSGRYQQRSGYECNLEPGYGLDTKEVTIADVFNKAGYHTIAVGKWHEGDKDIYHPNRRGFDDFYGFLTGSRTYFYNPKVDNPSNPHSMLQYNGKQVSPKQYMTYELGSRAEKFIADSGDSPFMMYLAFNAVHTPMEATKEDLALFEGHPRQTLAAMTYAVDKAIGGVVDKLKQVGKYDNTLIFFLSDNGGAHNNQSRNCPLKGWKGNKFEGGHRVPYFITYGDKLPKGSQYDGLCSSLDIFTTAIAIAGIDYDDKASPLDGVNVIPYITGKKRGEPHDILFWRKNQQKAVRQGDYKLIEVPGVGDILYNINDNINEDKDISKSNPRKRAQLLKKLHAWERGLTNPVKWDEGVWEIVNVEIHRALMNNESDIVKTPSEYKKRYPNSL